MLRGEGAGAARGRREGGASVACSGVRAAAMAASWRCGGVYGEGGGGKGVGTVSSCVQRRAAATLSVRVALLLRCGAAAT